MKSALEVYIEIYRDLPDTKSEEFKMFCLALYLCSKARNKNATPEHLERLKKKHKSVLPVI